jgi:hypothetical protein
VSDWTNGVTVAQMAGRLTPREAARVKYRAMLFRPVVRSPQLDALVDGNAAHRWFCFCLDAVARTEG